jgi:ketosteroid isomerase-like protein
VGRAEPFLIDIGRSNLPLQDDEQSTRDLFTTSKSAAAIGDLTRLLTLMAEDVVFLELAYSGPPSPNR